MICNDQDSIFWRPQLDNGNGLLRTLKLLFGQRRGPPPGFLTSVAEAIRSAFRSSRLFEESGAGLLERQKGLFVFLAGSGFPGEPQRPVSLFRKAAWTRSSWMSDSSALASGFHSEPVEGAARLQHLVAT